MADGRKVLVIVESTQEQHLALERAVITSEIKEPGSHVHLFISVDSEKTNLSADNENLYRDDHWLNAIMDKLKNAGASFSFELCWSNEWQKAVLASAQRFQPDHIFMPDSRDEKKSLFSNQQWALLRTSVAPVTIVRSSEIKPRKKILAAINIQKHDIPEYARLNEKILIDGQNIAKHYNADFFVVNAYKDSMHFPDRQKIMKISGLPSDRVHAEEGDPASVISRYAKEIDADTVLIGTMARQGASALMKGNTSEKVLSKIDVDVIAYS
ncbi:MAG: universal stress protein [Gammaproteobacteria bacterium]|nr:universal stress protein [Gammaproteobacteria bacterium]